ncbi:conserved hypothetical protein [Gammaproteobacteria bacterium]
MLHKIISLVVLLVWFDLTTAEEIAVQTILKNETALFTRADRVTGEALSVMDKGSGHAAGEAYKSESSANLFMNTRWGGNTKLHSQFALTYDPLAIEGYRGTRSYSQQDFLRELYIDTTVADDWALRLGKQQVVWETADGIKLLDIINPTDYREFVQNTFEDSRIPVWMAVADKPLGTSSSLQFIVAQAKENQIPGLSDRDESGQPFIMKGVDAITGPVNGFLHITPDLGGVAAAFATKGPLSLFSLSTVGEFANGQVPGFVPLCGGPCNSQALSAMVQSANAHTNLIDGIWNPAAPNSVFEYMTNATFATFNTFANAGARYQRNYPDDIPLNFGMRFKHSFNDIFNFSLNYLYHYDPNPVVDLHWENAAGQTLQPVATTIIGGNLANDPTAGGNANQVGKAYTTITLRDAAGNSYGAANPATLVFTERLNRIHSLGASFDTTLDSQTFGPVVLRGEFVYQHGVKTPVVDRSALVIGDLVNGLRPQRGDFFKYALGTDFTFFKNLMVNVQLIQFINLDYINEHTNSVTGTPCTEVNCGRYTAAPAVMSLSNGLQAGRRADDFLSLYLSKPFGEGQRGRVNNITIWEEGDGGWNRFDLEYSFSDHWIGLAEWNHYWGNGDTTFGQFTKSSNLQVGMKYLFN